MYKTVTPKEAKALIDEEGYRYVDVRSEFEYRQGHAVGAYNVPLAQMEPGVGMTPNPAFAGVMEANFPKDAKLVLACKSGGRSARACEMLARSGYTNLVNMDGGLDGRFSPMGALAQNGWTQESYPTTTDEGEGTSYESLATKP
jgi:rhodanese-related sulfurtransferase